jgi:hypothetical protein
MARRVARRLGSRMWGRVSRAGRFVVTFGQVEFCRESSAPVLAERFAWVTDS